MKLKKLANKSEKRVWDTLNKMLGPAGLYANSQVRLDAVIKLEKEDVSIEERRFIKAASFDAVIFKDDMLPMFAVEFDGPKHYSDSAHIKRDIIKNRICDKAKLPLLRLDSKYLKEFDHTNILNYICDRIIAYREEMPILEKEAQEYYESLPKEILESYISVGDLPFDPDFEFNIRHPFPETYNTANRLHNRFKIRTIFMEIDKFRNKIFRYDLELFPKQWNRVSGYEKYLITFKLTDLETKVLLYEDGISFLYQWAQPIEEDYNPNEAPVDYLLRTGKAPIAFLDIPGVHLPYIVENFCEYMALKQIEIYAENNLKRRK